jgi:hypothetical protein
VRDDGEAGFSQRNPWIAIAIHDGSLAHWGFGRICRDAASARRHHAAMRAPVLLWIALALPLAAFAQERRNVFDDPFLQVTSALAGCPVPRPPGYTPEEVRQEEHVRAQHGTSCYNSGRCRLPNSYLYDKEIIPRVQQFLQRDGRFGDTSVWVLGERRIVTLKGCVRSKEQAEAMERAVMQVDDVSGVVNELMVGTQGRPRYEVAHP